MPGLSGRPEGDDEVDPGTPDMDVSMYERGDLFDPSDCGGGQ